MENLIKTAFKIGLKSKYDHLFSLCKPWDRNGINEINLTYNFICSLEKNIGDSTVSIMEVKLKDNKHSRVDGFVQYYSERSQTIFFIESKKFKRSQIEKYGDSLSADINRLLNQENRKRLLDDLEIKNSGDQYLVFLFDHWKKNDSYKYATKWLKEKKAELENKGTKVLICDDIKANTQNRTDEEYFIYMLVLKIQQS